MMAKKGRPAKKIKDNQKDGCVHHWYINSANVGRCVRPGCDAVRDFGSMRRRAERRAKETSSIGGQTLKKYFT